MYPKLPNEEMKHEEGPSAILEANTTPARWVTLRLDGQTFKITMMTLANLGSAMLVEQTQQEGVIRIDQDPDTFKVLLTYARNGVIELPSNGSVTIQNLKAVAKEFRVSDSVTEAIDKYAKKLARQQKHKTNVKFVQDTMSNLAYTEDRYEFMSCMEHHNQITVGVGYVPRHNCDDKWHHRVDGITCDCCTITNLPSSVTKFIKPRFSSKNLVYKFELEKMRIECSSCHIDLKIRANLGWCHKCQCCVSCQTQFCFTPESFKEM